MFFFLFRVSAVVLLLSFTLISKVFADFTSYEAVYDLQIARIHSQSHINDVDGVLHYNLQRSCDGWKVAEDHAVSFTSEGGEVANFDTYIKTWESFDSTSFSFDIMEESSYKDPANHSGYSNNSGGVAEAYFTEENTKIELSSDINFPVQHLKAALSLAEKGEVFYQSDVFFGGAEDDAFYFTNTVIGQGQEAPEPLLGDLDTGFYWPLHTAYFKHNSTNSEPEYSITLHVQKNGIIRSYRVDYKSFSMRATLRAAKPLAPETC